METGQGAGGANGQGDGQQQGGNGEGTGTVPGLEAMAQQMQEFGQQLEPMREFLQSQQWQEIQQAQADPQQPQPQDDPFSGLDLGFLEDPSVAAQMDPEQFSQQLSQTISQAAEQIADRQVEQRVGPLEQAFQEAQREREVTALVGEFPEFGEEDTAKQVLQAAGQLAEQMGQPELGSAAVVLAAGVHGRSGRRCGRGGAGGHLGSGRTRIRGRRDAGRRRRGFGRSDRRRAGRTRSPSVRLAGSVNPVDAGPNHI
jgi:hypothetical protein